MLHEKPYNPNGELYGGKGTASLFLHITSNYNFMGFDILPDYGVFDIFKNPDIPARLKTTSGIWRNTACELAPSGIFTDSTTDTFSRP